MDTSEKYLSSSRDKEHVGTQFLKIEVNTAQLSPLLNPVSCLIKCIFYTKFYNALYWKYWFAGLFWVFANRVTILKNRCPDRPGISEHLVARVLCTLIQKWNEILTELSYL